MYVMLEGMPQVFYERTLNPLRLMGGRSAFLLGPRGTGKSTLASQILPSSPGCPRFDLLDDDVFSRLLRRPRLLGEEIPEGCRLVFIDEVQKLPKLLDEVHRLIESRSIQFLLTGSSSRKLKRGSANLLPARARSFSLFPLTSFEIHDFDLEKFCHVGGIPNIYLSDRPWLDLKAYVDLYIKEEIQAEAAARNIDHFARFLDIFGSCSGQELNYQQISSDSGVPARTLAHYIEVLKETLLVYELRPFVASKRKITTKSKPYLFDVGVANALAKRRNLPERSPQFGIAFEHFILQEIRAILAYRLRDEDMYYWRTYHGQEVDCIIGREIAVEIKSTEQVTQRHCKGLKSFQQERLVKRYILVSRDPVKKRSGGIEMMHWRDFLRELDRGFQ